MQIAILILVSLCLAGQIVIATALLMLLAGKPKSAPSADPATDALMNQIRQQLPMAIQRRQAPLAPAPNSQPAS
jgi:hypothetical protein